MKNIRIILISAIIFIAALSSLSIVLMQYSMKNSDSIYADIYSNGILIKTLELNNVKADETFTVYNDDEYNTIHVYGKSIAVTDSSCPNKICIHQGYISESNIPITCLPNRLVIKLRASNHKEDYDIVTY